MGRTRSYQEGSVWQRAENGRLIRSCNELDRGQGSSICPCNRRTPSRGSRKKGKSSHLTGLSDLSDDIVAHIFSHLPFGKVLELASVCKSWLRASQDAHAFKAVDLTWVDVYPVKTRHEVVDLDGKCEMAPKKSGYIVNHLQPRASALISLRLGLACQREVRRGMVTSEKLLALVSASKNLQKLFLSQPSSPTGLEKRIQQQILRAAADECPKLSSLEVSVLTFAGAGAIFPNLNALRLLNNTIYPRFPGVGSEVNRKLHLAVKSLPKLTQLQFHGSFSNELFLESLSLETLKAGGGKQFHLAAVSCPRLVNLHLIGHSQLYDAGPILLKGCPWLEQVKQLDNKTPTIGLSIWRIKWLNSNVVKLEKFDSHNYYLDWKPVE